MEAVRLSLKALRALSLQTGTWELILKLPDTGTLTKGIRDASWLGNAQLDSCRRG